jgi:hypothetical protein
MESQLFDSDPQRAQARVRLMEDPSYQIIVQEMATLMAGCAPTVFYLTPEGVPVVLYEDPVLGRLGMLTKARYQLVATRYPELVTKFPEGGVVPAGGRAVPAPTAWVPVATEPSQKNKPYLVRVDDYTWMRAIYYGNGEWEGMDPAMPVKPTHYMDIADPMGKVL